jgi:hypothetical protein
MLRRRITTPGAPALPVVKAALIVPWGSSINGISVADTASEELEGDYLVYPAQESVFTGIDDARDFVFVVEK